MAVKEFSRRFSAISVLRPRLRVASPVAIPPVSASRLAGEAAPLNSDKSDESPIPVEDTVSPEMCSTDPETVEKQIKQIDPQWDTPIEDGQQDVMAQASLADPDALNKAFGMLATAALHDELAQSNDVPEETPVDMMADGPPGSDEGKDRSPLPDADKGQPGQVPSTEQHVQAPHPAGIPTSPAPAAGQPPASDPSSEGGQVVFNFVEGLDPTDRGKLVNDWQDAVDNKLFSRHTNVFHIAQEGNNCVLTVQAYNTDSGTQPAIQTGYAVDGVERGELMGHLREIFQPNGPAVTHVANVYNSFIEKQADLGKMKLIRLKVVNSQFTFNPDQRMIEGWADGGIGKEPQWRKTPYTVYSVRFTLSFATIGQTAPVSPAPPHPQPGAV